MNRSFLSVIDGEDFYEAGFHQGKLCRNNLNQLLSNFPNMEEIQLMKPKFLPYQIFLRVAKNRATKTLAPIIKKNMPEAYDFYEGMSEGSGLSFETFMLFQSMEMILAIPEYYIKEQTPEMVMTGMGGGCTTTCVDGQFTKTGMPIMTKNFDYPKSFQYLMFAKKFRIDNMKNMIGYGATPLLGIMHGINEDGLTMSYDYGYPQDGFEPGLPPSLVLTDMMFNCSTVDDCLDRIQDYPIGSGAIVTFADQANEVQVMELSSKQHPSRSLNGDKFIVATNHLLTKELRDHDIPDNAYFGEKSVKALRGERCQESSQKRYDRAVEVLEKIISNGKLDVEDMKQVISDHSPNSPEGDNNCICRHGSYYETTVAMILDPKKKEIHGCIGKPCSTELNTLKF